MCSDGLDQIRLESRGKHAILGLFCNGSTDRFRPSPFSSGNAAFLGSQGRIFNGFFNRLAADGRRGLKADSESNRLQTDGTYSEEDLAVRLVRDALGFPAGETSAQPRDERMGTMP